MEIRIRRTGTEDVTGDGTDLITTYLVTDRGREFIVTSRARLHGTSLGLAGKEGSLYVDRDDDTVRRQVVALGGACGLNIDEEVVEGLSPWAIHGVIMAEKNRETGEFTVTVEANEDGLIQPAVTADGTIVDAGKHLKP